jgi:hypothetical protein
LFILIKPNTQYENTACKHTAIFCADKTVATSEEVLAL